jgi:hypothetical protein
MSNTKALFQSSVESTNILQKYWSQYMIMMRRNTILQYRFIGATIAQAFVAPFIFNLLVYSSL